MIGYDYSETAEDRALLLGFVDYAADLIRQMIFEPGEIPEPIQLVPGLDAYLRAAWEETQPEIGRMRQRIRTVQNYRLERSGLTRRSLRGKLYVLKYWVGQAVEGIAGAFWHVLDNLNSIFESILNAVGAGDALRELKDLFHNGRKDLDDNHPGRVARVG